MPERDLKIRTNDFAHRCVKMASAMPNGYTAHHIRKQLIRCSTSVAANYRAACLAQSKASFIAKLSICIEESDESCFWIEFLRDENLVPENKLNDLLSEAKQLTSILITSRKTASKKKD